MGGPTWNFGGGLTYPCHGTIWPYTCKSNQLAWRMVDSPHPDNNSTSKCLPMYLKLSASQFIETKSTPLSTEILVDRHCSSRSFTSRAGLYLLDHLFPIGLRSKGAPCAPTNVRKLTLAIEAVCVVLAQGLRYLLSVGPAVNENKSEVRIFQRPQSS